MEEGPKTRSREKKRKLEEGIPEEEPKPKMQTLGQYLWEEREKEANELQEKEEVQELEPFQDYDKDEIIQKFGGQKREEFDGVVYDGKEVKMVFLTLEYGEHPKTFTHLCNNSCLIWNLQKYDLPSTARLFGIPSVVLLFVRGKFVEGTTENGNMYKYLGPTGIQSTSSGNVNGTYKYLETRFVFNYVLSRKELALFGDNLMKCKKNKYGCSLCK
jgi:hypothetical protein